MMLIVIDGFLICVLMLIWLLCGENFDVLLSRLCSICMSCVLLLCSIMELVGRLMWIYCLCVVSFGWMFLMLWYMILCMLIG